MINVPPKTSIDSVTSHSIPVGHFIAGEQVKYLAIIQDSDGDDRSKGEATFSDFKFIRHDTNKLEITIEDTPVYLDNNQLPYMWNNQMQDTNQFKMGLSEEGKSLQINGNQWKALEIPTPYNVAHT